MLKCFYLFLTVQIIATPSYSAVLIIYQDSPFRTAFKWECTRTTIRDHIALDVVFLFQLPMQPPPPTQKKKKIFSPRKPLIARQHHIPKSLEYPATQKDFYTPWMQGRAFSYQARFISAREADTLLSLESTFKIILFDKAYS